MGVGAPTKKAFLIFLVIWAVVIAIASFMFESLSIGGLMGTFYTFMGFIVYQVFLKHLLNWVRRAYKDDYHSSP